MRRGAAPQRTEKLLVHRFPGGPKAGTAVCSCGTLTWEAALAYWRQAPRADVMAADEDMQYCDQRRRGDGDG